MRKEEEEEEEEEEAAAAAAAAEAEAARGAAGGGAGAELDLGEPRAEGEALGTEEARRRARMGFFFGAALHRLAVATLHTLARAAPR